MYKHSHRRNVECIPDALSFIPEYDIKYFNDMWQFAQGNQTHKSTIKFMCRKYILRLLIDNVQRKGYFDKLMVENSPIDERKRNLYNRDLIIGTKSEKDESSSYARKISTILHRYALREGKDSYLSFQQLIKAVLKSPCMQYIPTNKKIKNLGKILYLMNETRNEITNWTSLVCIKYDSSERYNEVRLCEILNEQWELYKHDQIEINDTSKFGIKITDAGSLFSKIIADFEYFACRFLTNYPHCVLRPFVFVHEKPFCPLNSGVVEHSPILSKFIKFHLFTPFFVQVVVKMVVKKVVVNPY